MTNGGSRTPGESVRDQTDLANEEIAGVAGGILFPVFAQ
jgi:hypothetical protein